MTLSVTELKMDLLVPLPSGEGLGVGRKNVRDRAVCLGSLAILIDSTRSFSPPQSLPAGEG